MRRTSYLKGTRRQQVTSRTGVPLERQSIYMPTEVWADLARLSHAQSRSFSLVIQSLIAIAAKSAGTPVNTDAH